jgi:virulence factor Mce-like protein
MAVGTVMGFRKDIPFTKGFRVKAQFESATSIRPNSPVRVAGVNVGIVKKVTRYENSDQALVEMEIKDAGLPIHKDAQMRIRSRIFLEGNFFVDLSPGSPQQPAVEDGGTIPVTQTSTPVQLDEVLTALQSDTREDLQTVLAEYGRTLDGDPKDSDRGQDPVARGEKASKSLNDTYVDAGPALRGTAIVNEALLGEEPHDLSRLIRGLGTVTSALGRNERVLQDMVTNFNRTMAIFGDEKANVSATIRGLSELLPQADRTFASLNRAFPPTRAFAREILPGVRETPETIEASFPWIRQTRALLGPRELQGVARELSPATRDLSRVINESVRLFPQQDLIAKCLTRVVLPTGDIKIQDGNFTTGVENYKEFWYTQAGIAGEGQNFDGNGQYVRFQPGGGSQTLANGPRESPTTEFFRLASPPLGVRPVYPGKRPPYRPNVPCFTQQIPDLNSARTGPPDGGQGPAAGGPGQAQQRSRPAQPQPQPQPKAAPREESLAGELADRLNPWRKGGGR